MFVVYVVIDELWMRSYYLSMVELIKRKIMKPNLEEIRYLLDHQLRLGTKMIFFKERKVGQVYTSLGYATVLCITPTFKNFETSLPLLQKFHTIYLWKPLEV